MANDPLGWEIASQKSYEDLRKEANATKAKRENLQPMALGKGQYANIFKVGDRTRPELALRLSEARTDEIGSGQVDLAHLIPEQAFKDIEHALAQANVTAVGETLEGVREQITYDSDEVEVQSWLENRAKRLQIAPPAIERSSTTPDNAAYTPENND